MSSARTEAHDEAIAAADFAVRALRLALDEAEAAQALLHTPDATPNWSDAETWQRRGERIITYIVSTRTCTSEFGERAKVLADIQAMRS